MARLDIQSIVTVTEVQNASSPSSSKLIETGQHINSYTQQVNDVKKDAHGPAVSMNPIFIMTPDGVLHIKMDEEHHSPEITLNSFNVAHNK